MTSAPRRSMGVDGTDFIFQKDARQAQGIIGSIERFQLVVRMLMGRIGQALKRCQEAGVPQLAFVSLSFCRMRPCWSGGKLCRPSMRTNASGGETGIICRQQAPHPFWHEMVFPDCSVLDTSRACACSPKERNTGTISLIGMNPVGTSTWACISPEVVSMERLRRSEDDGIVIGSAADHVFS